MRYFLYSYYVILSRLILNRAQLGGCYSYIIWPVICNVTKLMSGALIIALLLGEKYVGYYKDDKRDGRGTLTTPDGERNESLTRNIIPTLPSITMA